jgi:hypothetical protein
MIWKIWKKSNLKCEVIRTTWKKIGKRYEKYGRKSEKIGKIQKKIVK